MKVRIANVRCFLCDCVILFSVGQAEDNIYNNKGGGSNYLCLPNDPDNANHIHMLMMLSQRRQKLCVEYLYCKQPCSIYGITTHNRSRVAQ